MLSNGGEGAVFRSDMHKAYRLKCTFNEHTARVLFAGCDYNSVTVNSKSVYVYTYRRNNWCDNALQHSENDRFDIA